MKPVPWSVVAIVTVIVAGMCVLVLAGKDTVAIGGIAVVILAGLGFSVAQGQQIQQNTNGTQARMLSILENLAGRLAESTPPDHEEPKPPGVATIRRT